MKLVILSLLLSFSAIAADRNGVSAYLAAGSLLGIGSVRIGANQWEAGLHNVNALAVSKKFYKGDFYFGFGPCAFLDVDSSFGFYGGAGYEVEAFAMFYLRGEVAAAASHLGRTKSEMLLGLSAYF